MLIFKRLEKDYEREHPGLVGQSLSLIWAARRGLAEQELLDLSGNGQKPLPHAFWSPLFLALEPSLIIRSGLISFFHNYLRQAIQTHYLVDPIQQQNFHSALAAYFLQREPNIRTLDELPWQLAKAGDWYQLTNVLSSPSFFYALWQKNQYDAKMFWAQIEKWSSARMVEAYQMVLKSTRKLSTLLAATGQFAAGRRPHAGGFIFAGSAPEEILKIRKTRLVLH